MKFFVHSLCALASRIGPAALVVPQVPTGVLLFPAFMAKKSEVTVEFRTTLRTPVTWYARTLVAVFALAPVFVIFYLRRFVAPNLLFEHQTFHIVAIAIAILSSAFVTGVAWRCYVYSGEPFLRWLTVALLAFTVIYAFHGVMTPYADRHLWLFILYGPASRLVMAACLLTGMLVHGRLPDGPQKRVSRRYWGAWIVLFLGLDILIGVLALSPIGAALAVRMSLELSAMLLMLASLAVLILRRVRSPLMIAHGLALAWFAESSLAFLLSAPWSHIWWLAHLIFTSGFLALSYAVAQSYLSTRSFSVVYSYADLIDQINAEKARAEHALAQLQEANEQLSQEVATDVLTGVTNRRGFMIRAEHEWKRMDRTHSPLSVLVIDLDHFKQINDRHGHAAGDQVLKAFSSRAHTALRPTDLLARVGGEEFAVLLPDTGIEGARFVGERVRHAIQGRPFALRDCDLRLTVSIGAAEARRDAESFQDCLKVADQRMYRAKQAGRNRVE